MALPGSGEIHFGALVDNKDSASRSDVSLATISQQFAVGSLVGDIDGSGTGNQTADRNLLAAAPYAISEFYDAEYVNEFFDTVVAKLPDGTAVTDDGYVDDESATISFYVRQSNLGPSYTAGLKLASNSSIVVSETETESGTGTKIIAFTAPSRAAATNVYYPFVSTGTYENAVGGNIDHYDQLTGASINAVSTQYVNSSGQTTPITFGHSNTNGIVTSRGWTFTNASNGNNSAISITTSAQSTPIVTFTGTGTFPIGLSLYGNPSTARNVDTDSTNVNVQYVNAIDGIAQSQGNVNVSAVDGSGNATFVCDSEGYSGTLTIGYDDNDTASDTSYTNTTEPVNTTYQREGISKNLTISSANTYYPKAHHDGDAVVGSAFIVAPALAYTTTNDQTIDVGATQGMAASVSAGTNASVAITSSPNIGSGTNSATMTPGSNNGSYTISYAGTANYSPNNVNNQTDTLTVRPKIDSLTPSPSTVYGFGSYASNKTPTGVSTTNTTVTAATTGTISGTGYSWTTPAGTTVSGGESGDFSVRMNFSGASGTKTFYLTVAGTAIGGSNTTSTQASTSVTYTAYTQQSISSVTPNSGDYRRGATTINVAWTSINVALVDIHLVADGSGTSTTAQTTNNDSLDVANTSEGQTYSAAIVDVGRTNVGTYHVRVRDASDNVPTSTAVSTISVLDTYPTVPGAFQDTAGGYNGSLVMDWAVTDGDAYQYQVHKSSGDSNASYSQLDSNQSGVSKTISASSTSTYGPFYYKIRALNFAQGGTSTEYSSYNTARRFIIFPTLGAGNNIPQPASSTIYSTTNNSTTTQTVMNVTSDSDNTNMSYSWATSLTTGAGISSTTAQNPTISAGAGVGTITATLTVTADANAQNYTHSGDSITVNYYPKIVSAAYTDPVIIVNDTHVVVNAINWQGFSEASGLQLSIRNGSGGIVGSNTTVNYSNTEGGLQTIVNKTGLSIDLGDSSSAGTMKVRIAKQSNTSFYSEFDVVISDYTSISIYGVGNGYSTPEHALRAKLGEAGIWSTTTKYFLPGISYGNGADLYNDNEGNRYQGGTYYHGYKPGSTTDYFSVNTNGDINTIYSGDAAVPPRNPTGGGNSSAQASIAISNFSVSNYTHSNSGTTTATFSNWVTTKTVTVTWNDISYINDGYKIHETNSSGALKGTAAENAQTDDISGITGNITFAIYAIGNSNGNPSLYSLGNTTTSYSHTNDGTLYLHATNNSGGATTNLDDITSGTTFTWDKNDLAAGVYTFRVRYGSYTGTTIATDSSVTVLAGSNITFDPTSISTIDVVDGSDAWSSVINASIAGGYHNFSGDFTTVAIATSAGSGIVWTLNASEEFVTTDPGTSGGSSSVSLTGIDDEVYFRVRAREAGGSVGDESIAIVTVTHGATGYSNVVGTFAVDAEVISSGGGKGGGS